MSLARRIIPIVLHRGKQLVKSRQFKPWRVVGDALQAARIHGKRGVDELLLLNIGRQWGEAPNVEIVRQLTEDSFTPVTVGGGVRGVADAKLMMDAGADKVSVCTGQFAANAIEDIADHYGSQAVCGVVDYRGTLASGCTYTECGTDVWPFGAGRAAYEMAEAGAGEIILQSIDRDGMMEGYDLDTIAEVAAKVDIPVIAAGGCGSPEHMLAAFQAGASACAAGSMFLFTDYTPRSCAEFLAQRGVEVRI